MSDDTTVNVNATASVPAGRPAPSTFLQNTMSLGQFIIAVLGICITLSGSFYGYLSRQDARITALETSQIRTEEFQATAKIKFEGYDRLVDQRNSQMMLIFSDMSAIKADIGTMKRIVERLDDRKGGH